MRDVSMTLSQLELALLGGLPLRKLDQLIASRCAPIYARPQSRRAACYTLHEAVMLVTGMIIGTMFTLFVVPSIYMLVAKRHTKLVEVEGEREEELQEIEAAAV